MKYLFYDHKLSCGIATAQVPDSWQPSGRIDTGVYYGRFNPLGYYLKAVSPDGRMMLDCYSQADYSNPLAVDSPDKVIKEGSILWYPYRPAAQCLSERLARTLPQAQSFSLCRHDFNSNDLNRIQQNKSRYMTELMNRWQPWQQKPENISYEDITDIYDITVAASKPLRAGLHVAVGSYEIKNEKGMLIRNWEILHDTMFCSPADRFEENYAAYLAFDQSIIESDDYQKLLADKRPVPKVGPKKTESASHVRFARNDNGADLVGVKIPDDWTLSYSRSSQYGGYGFPFRFTLTAKPAAGSARLYYLSPYYYCDDFSRPAGASAVSNDSGDLLRPFMKVEDFIDAMTRSDLKDVSNLRFIKRLTPPFGKDTDYQQLSRQKLDQARQNSAGRIINMCYIDGATMIYSYDHHGTARLRAYSAQIDADEYTEYQNTQLPPSLLNDPFMQLNIRKIYPGFHIDEKGRPMFCAAHLRHWFVNFFTVFDAEAADFNLLYEKVYEPFSGYGTCWTQALKDEMKQRQNEINSRNKAIRDDKANAQRIRNQMEKDRLQAQKERADINRNSAQEISRLNKDSYEKTSRAADRSRQRFSDSFLGNQRYTDRYNDEYVVHGTGRYAYKNGSTIVSTDDPVGPGFGWEELNHKK